MDTRNILDRLLERSQQATNAGIGMADDGRAGSTADDERVAMLKGAGAGALGAGAVALLFGSKGTRKFAKKAARLGGTAALGGLAYKVYTDWQAQQEASGAGAAGTRAEPADVARIAALADTRETAAELYVASAMVADADDSAGRAYLDSLADVLALDPTVTRGLEEPLRT